MILILLCCASITDTDISFINRVRPTRVIKKDRVCGVNHIVQNILTFFFSQQIVRPYALHDAIGGTVIDVWES